MALPGRPSQLMQQTLNSSLSLTLLHTQNSNKRRDNHRRADDRTGCPPRSRGGGLARRGVFAKGKIRKANDFVNIKHIGSTTGRKGHSLKKSTKLTTKGATSSILNTICQELDTHVLMLLAAISKLGDI